MEVQQVEAPRAPRADPEYYTSASVDDSSSLCQVLLCVLPDHHRSTDMCIQTPCNPQHWDLQADIQQRQQRHWNAILLIANQQHTALGEAV